MNSFLVVAAIMAALAAAAVAVPLMRDRQSRLVGAVAAVLIAASAAALYPLWSNWNWHDQGQPAAPDVLAMVAKLENHLRDEPKDTTGWVMLGRSYVALERLDDAILAYDHARRLDASNAEAALGLGESISLRAGGNITPPAAELFEQALTLAPSNPKALLYAGFAAAARGDATAARARWQALKDMHPPQQIEKMLDARLAELDSPGAPPAASAAAPATLDASTRNPSTPGAATPAALTPGATVAGTPTPGRSVPAALTPGATVATTPTPNAATPGASVPGTTPAAAPASASVASATVTIRIAPELKSRLTREAPLFVFAREPGGRGPPLAAKRLTSAAIGTQVHLSGADSMIPGRVLVGGRQVSITARISFSGQPLPVAGDLYGELTYDVGSGVARELVIDRVAE